jgi:predicted nuclease of restriction endonuclease-like (RecB) superfamily
MLEVKSKTDGSEIIKSNDYARFLSNLKEKVRTSQQKAIVQVNQQLILLYHHIGSEILRLQKEKGWGSKVIDQLSKDLKSSFPEMKGFSLSNLKYMKQFAESFTEQQISQQAAGQLPWFHLVTIISSIKDFETQSFYIQKTIENGWSRGHLLEQIKAGLHKRSGKAITNFQTNLPAPFSDLAEQSLKDPYLFDFLTVGREAHEKAIENAIIEHIEKFLLELGTGFAFVGRQYKLTVSDKSYYIDLLFYHLKLRSFVVVEIKANEFKPSHIGQVNFYLSAVDDLLRHPTDNPTIGLILCEHKDNVTAEYALKDINKPIGISEYQLSKSIPENLRDLLPSVDDIEAQLNREQISKEVSK